MRIEPTESIPPLEIPEEPPIKKLKTIWIFGFFAVMLSLLVILSGVENAHLTLLQYAGTFLAMFLFQFIATSVRSIGHIVASSRIKYEFLTTLFGPIRLYRDRNGLHLDWVGFSTLFEGATICLPHDSEDLRNRHRIFITSGSIANFGVGIPAVLAGIIIFIFSISSLDFFLLGIGLFLFLIGFASSLYGLAFLFRRNHPGVQESDNKQLQLLDSETLEANRYYALLKLDAMRFSGTRPRDFDAKSLGDALAYTDGSARDAIAHDFAYEHYLDLREYRKARDHLQSTLEILHSSERWLRPLVIVKAVEFEIHIRKDLENARKLYNKLEKKKALAPRSPFYFACADTAFLLADGKVREARHRLEVAKIELSKSIALQATEIDREWIAELERQVQENLASAPGV